MDIERSLRQGRYVEVLTHVDAKGLIQVFVQSLLGGGETAAQNAGESNHLDATQPCNTVTALNVGLGAFAAFLQVNVTGPVLDSSQSIDELLALLENKSTRTTCSLRQACLSSLDVDGISVYRYTPQIELFCLARWVFLTYLSPDDYLRPKLNGHDACTETDPAEKSLRWMRLRIQVWHYKLLTEPNAGPGSVFNKMTQWSDLPSLQEQIQQYIAATEKQLDTEDHWCRQDRVQFLVEKTNIYAVLGLDSQAQASLNAASKLNRFEYILSGALGKRTRFQEKSTSQLVILARSADGTDDDRATNTVEDVAATEHAVPQALPLNNDTLLENIDFSDANHDMTSTEAVFDKKADASSSESISISLKNLSPDDQPQLSSLDQIILLSMATLKDAFSPTDSLTMEEILPYATRVLSDKSTNWQIYTQALIVRSRIELHRSRTVERGVLQMQAMVDQVVVDTMATKTVERKSQQDGDTELNSVPTIAITAPGNEDRQMDKPTSIFPAPKSTEQAPPEVRLRYIHALSTPPRWHLESELAFAWASVGSLVSALEIFKRLRLWAEVALCLASNSAMDDEGGRGAGGEEKARGLIRWQLFQASDPSLEPKGGSDNSTVDVLSFCPSDFEGPERDPPPTNSPRLLCILGDIEAEPKHYERAWELSKCRYSRAQRSLGEHYLQKREWKRALDAYKKAVSANRLNSQLWSRLGDINLRLGLFADAAESFSRAIGAANDASGGEDARTWSNLGSSLYSLYTETIQERQVEARTQQNDGATDASRMSMANGEKDSDKDGRGAQTVLGGTDPAKRDPATLLTQSLAAFKRGATISHNNWRIWDNVVTIASRIRPPVVGDIILALRNILAVRETEDAVDIDVIRLLLHEAVLSKPRPVDGVPSRGSPEKAICSLIEDSIVPLITKRSELWELVARARAWKGDFGGAIDAAEKGWRAATVGGTGMGTLGSTMAASGSSGREAGADKKRNWLENADAWDDVVSRTDELVSMLENYGAEVPTIGSRWRMKARSALRSVMGKGRERWEGSPGWTTLENLLEGLK